MPTRTDNGPELGRRERNKQAKLDRIVQAATELFAERGVDDVTTQEVADRADIGSGTLFLYVKTKGDLLLLVENALYSAALERGRTAAASETDPVTAIMAIERPIVTCNRSQVDNGRTYLREMAFGDPTEANHAVALGVVRETEAAVVDVLTELTDRSADEAAVLTQVITSIMFLTMSTAPRELGVDDIADLVERQLRVILPAEPRSRPSG